MLRLRRRRRTLKAVEVAARAAAPLLTWVARDTLDDDLTARELAFALRAAPRAALRSAARHEPPPPDDELARALRARPDAATLRRYLQILLAFRKALPRTTKLLLGADSE